MKVIDYINESVRKKLTEANVKLKSYVQTPDGIKGYVKNFKLGEDNTMMANLEVVSDGKTSIITVPADSLEKASMESTSTPVDVKLEYVRNTPTWVSAEIVEKEQRTNLDAVLKAISIFNRDNNKKGLPVSYNIFHRDSSLEEIKKLLSLGKYTVSYISTNPKNDGEVDGKFKIYLQLNNFTPEYTEMMQSLFKEIDGEEGVETLDLGSDDSNAYTYHINLDERGTFFADVRDANDKTVFEIHDFDIFEHGFMKHKEDIDGLRKYLVNLGIISPGDKLIDDGQSKSGISESAVIKKELIKALEPIKIKIQSLK